MTHFDLDDRYQDENVVGCAVARREAVFLSIVFHGLLLAALIYVPQIPFLQLTPEDLQRRRTEIQRQLEDERERSTFVFVQPRIDMPAEQPPERAELSDLDRLAQTPEVVVIPENPLPPSLGDSVERVEPEAAELARGAEEPPQSEPETEVARVQPPSDSGFRRPMETPPSIRGSLGEALRDLQSYMQNETFDNPRGGNDRPGATIQFDTKGVEFGP